MFVPSCSKKFRTIAEAVKNSSAGDVIKLGRGVFEEAETIFLDKDGLVLEAASSESDDGELSNWSSATVSFAGDQKKGLVCSAHGIKVVGIRFTMQNKRGQEAAQPNPDQQITSCIAIESGDACLTDCFVSNSSVSSFSFLFLTFILSAELSLLRQTNWGGIPVPAHAPCSQLYKKPTLLCGKGRERVPSSRIHSADRPCRMLCQG